MTFRILWIFILLGSCTEVVPESTPDWASAQGFFDWLHVQEIEPTYDGPTQGTWGQVVLGYRVPLRDIYWKVESYMALGLRGGAHASEYLSRAESGVGALVRFQTQGGTGAFGMPDEPLMPEFGPWIQSVESLNAGIVGSPYIRGGWIVDLPSDKIDALYYDHGRCLTVLAKYYLQVKPSSQEIKNALIQGSSWALSKPVSTNVNYNSSLAEGLSWAYRALGDENLRIRAWELTTQGVLGARNPNGSYGDIHNQKLRYHGFILGGLVAVFQNLVPGAERDTMKNHISTARAYLRDHLISGDPQLDPEALGINLRVLGELQTEINSGGLVSLSQGEVQALKFLVDQAVGSKALIQSLSSGYSRQKSHWHFVQLGVALAQFR